jgi:poly(3-hydroxybutyrate) depolymerase
MLYNFYSISNVIRSHVNFAATVNANLAQSVPFAREWYALNKLVQRSTNSYTRPEFDLGVAETDVLTKPFCDLLQFAEVDAGRPNVLVVAPMSGHYATLLRGTVKEFLPDHNVYITDWRDAGAVPLEDGVFGFDDYVTYLMDFIRYFNGNVHLVAVCQPSVPVIAAVSLLAANDEPTPKSMTLMGGPIDTRINPTEVDELATTRPYSWFEQNLIYPVSMGKKGHGRRVYPGFLQLAGFMSMNLDRHVKAHREYFDNLVSGDGESAAHHEKFYDEYLAVMDLDAKFYLETIKMVFQEHQLPQGTMVCHDQLIKPSMISKTCLMTIEGEKDDITGVGQTMAAHDLCPNVPYRDHYMVEGVGHYGIFNGKRFRDLVAPRIKTFIQISR